MENELFVGRLAEAGIVDKQDVEALVKQLKDEGVSVYAFHIQNGKAIYRASVRQEGEVSIFQGAYSRENYEAYKESELGKQQFKK